MEKLIEITSENGIWLTILAITVFAVGIISLTIRFDLNKWYERRDNARIRKVRSLCTHVSIDIDENDRISVESYYFTPAMSPYWICRRCGVLTLDSRLPKQNSAHWGRNPKEWIEKEKEFLKLAEKMGTI